jgi:hypothetical protein
VYDAKAILDILNNMENVNKLGLAGQLGIPTCRRDFHGC